MSRRRPRWLPLGAALAATSLFAALGLWQLERAGEKGRLVAAIERGTSAPVLSLPTDPAEFAPLAYQRVRVTGTLVGRRQFLLDNRIHEGRVGFDVLVPLVRGNGDIILIDRGWVPASPGREPARPIRLGAAGEVTVRGRLWLPPSGFALGPALSGPASEWPRLATRIDYTAFGRALGRELLPAVIRADASVPWALEPRALEPAFGPMRHFGYAVQWFALALTVVVISTVLWWRHGKRERR